MAVFAIRLKGYSLRRVIGFNAVDTLLVIIYDTLMRKGAASKLPLDMTHLCTVHGLYDRIMGNLVDVDMAVSAGNVPVEGIVVELRVHVVVPEDFILVIGPDALVFVAKKAVFGV
jgi:hypothetical protein